MATFRSGRGFLGHRNASPNFLDGELDVEKPSPRDTRQCGSRGSQGDTDGNRTTKRHEFQRDFQELSTIGFATTVMGT